MLGAVFIEGENVQLRTIEEEDAEQLRDIINHPEVRRFLGQKEPLNLEDEQEWVENLGDDELTLCITTDGEIVGNVHVREKEQDVGSIGIMIHPDHQEKGYGTEATRLAVDHAFNQMRFHRIKAKVAASNDKSAALWEKLGFTKEATLREQFFKDGEYENVCIYGILSREWRQSHA